MDITLVGAAFGIVVGLIIGVLQNRTSKQPALRRASVLIAYPLIGGVIGFLIPIAVVLIGLVVGGFFAAQLIFGEY